jgi:hypothetical protein
MGGCETGLACNGLPLLGGPLTGRACLGSVGIASDDALADGDV